MQPGKYSFMAEAVAGFRAAHQVIDDDPKILADPLALVLLGPNAAADIEAERERHSRWYMQRARALAVVRSRYTEDQLVEAIGNGVRQYVILGAGLDTSPYRPGHPGEVARTWEIDHPDSQRWKLECLRQAGIDCRDNLQHLAVDFERQLPLDILMQHGFDREQPAFFSWLGVNYYLHPEAVVRMFRQIATCARESRLVLDFVVSDDVLDEAERESVRRVMAVAEQRGEPWLSRFAPDELRQLMTRSGFGATEHLDREQATEKYLAGRSDGLSLANSIQLMTAVV